MASPHVNGVVAMMRQANPNIAVEEVKQIIYDTAYDLGSTGEDNDYGWGMIDAYECVIAAMATNNITFEFPNGLPDMVDPSGGTAVRVEVVGQSVDPEPGTGMLYYRTGGGAYTSTAMVEITPNVYDAVFPALDCLATVEYYFSADTVDGETVYHPFNAPDRVYAALVAKGIDVVFEDDFENDKGWRTSYSNLTGGRWQRGTPIEGNGAPATDYDGSGQCWLTELAYGKDVDGGPARLESPTFGVSDGGVILNFGYWHYSQYGVTDELEIEVSRNDGSTWVPATTYGHGTKWAAGSVRADDYVTASPNMKMRVLVSDNPDDSRTESGLDAFSVSNVYCDRMGLDVTPLIGGQNATLTVTDATSGNDVYFIYSLKGLGYKYVNSLAVVVDLAGPQLAGLAAADGSGTAELVVSVPNAASGKTVWFQGVESGRKTSTQSHKVN
ncbi:MAG: S8 family serine peptidase [Planctomycetes bacterium]|nr:S8 family serine peptidase [Planctomycetota bacterium]